MLLTIALLSFVFLHNVTCEESSDNLKTPAGKSIGSGYGYSQGSYGRGSSYGYSGGNRRGDSYGDYEHGSNSGHGDYEHGSSSGHGDYEHGSSSEHGQGYNSGGGSYRHNRGHVQKHVPIQIPYIDRNGCRFPGDVVCDPDVADPPITYGYCILSDENKNLWKKPTMEIIAADCVPTGTRVLTDFCNDNERLLKAAGLIKDKDIHKRYYHQQKYSVSLNPCILVLPP